MSHQSLSLFPNPNASKPPSVVRNTTPRGRRSESRERRAATPQQTTSSEAVSPSRHGRQTPQQALSPDASSPPRLGAGQHTPQLDASPIRQGRQPPRFDSPQSRRHHDWPANDSQRHNVAFQQPRPAADVPDRAHTDTALSQAQTLVRSPSVRSRSSIAKLPLPEEESSGSAQEQPLRSIFPSYNPDLPLDQQPYLPTQMSPTHIPRAVISRQGYRPSDEEDLYSGVEQPSYPSHQPFRSPRSPELAPRWARRPAEPPVTPKTCSAEQLKSLWKVANGWRASGSEGRVYCLQLTQDKEAPVFVLSSTTQPFYNIRLDPTSTSANLTVSRLDPNKPYKSRGEGGLLNSVMSSASGSGAKIGSGSSSQLDSKLWTEALSTKLEEEARRRPPNDGLVALLMPSAAAKMAEDKPDDPASVFTAEREAARLVWDEDSQSHYLVHPALATPFCITIERLPAWSRTEYTLEHHESPQHVAKLTRDGSGGGWLELDTGIAGKIESYFILDVAVTALMLVAAADAKNVGGGAAAESFEPPPPPVPPKTATVPGSRAAKRASNIEEFEIDLESQDGSLGKGWSLTRSKEKKSKAHKSKSKEDKLPFVIRVIVLMAKGIFKLIVGILSLFVKCFTLGFRCLYKCFGSKY